MNHVIAEAKLTRRQPTIAAVERTLGVTHPTFYRNFADLIAWFKQQVRHDEPTTILTATGHDPAATLTRLRHENEDLRRLVNIYAETIRQLSVDNDVLRAKVESHAGVVDLATRRELLKQS